MRVDVLEILDEVEEKAQRQLSDTEPDNDIRQTALRSKISTVREIRRKVEEIADADY